MGKDRRGEEAQHREMKSHGMRMEELNSAHDLQHVYKGKVPPYRVIVVYNVTSGMPRVCYAHNVPSTWHSTIPLYHRTHSKVTQGKFMYPPVM